RDVYTGAERKTVDIGARLEALAAFRARGRAGAQALGANPDTCARADQAARQWRRLVDAGAAGTAVEPGALLAAAYPDRIAVQRRLNDVQYLLSSGRGARLPVYETQSRAPYLVAAHLDAGATEGVIHLAASLTLDEIRDVLAAQIVREDVVRWGSQSAAVVARREGRTGKLVLRTER